jgi:hypothetical protein
MTESTNDSLDLVPLREGGLELELSEMESLAVRSLLSANGIDAVVAGASVMPNLPYELLVPRGQVDNACRIILDAQSAGAEAAEDAEAAGEQSGDQPPIA